MHSAWKWVGLAGAIGMAAGGVLVARDQRQRNAYSADDVRERLHRRHADAQARTGGESGDRP
ncbi:hypothetical protein [Gordonia hankookensis]|uniref:Uncharacterized protein n=1 Tax=Gordonia hankookensis TaxID=589403 RepID=A0ABR7W6M4_9ACTN|nr:hypothetical protein [Gordonia hankookensis]MBD1318471.1 hypothetical protein [Gordonia hankookensis]NDZ94005.1 hypothetical protein [Streptomyces sp. SID11726]NEB25345.1 hypothetical protein [Streptomyces sp. SID6673]